MQPKPASSTNLLALPEGTELVGDYQIKRVLGAGGFGITYLAEEVALGHEQCRERGPPRPRPVLLGDGGQCK